MIEQSAKEKTKCPVCEMYISAEEGFVCPKCRRGPFCKSHRAAGSRFCSSCYLESKLRELVDMKNQEQGIRSFLRLTQFLFIVCAIFFISFRMGITESIEFLQEIPLTDNVIYSIGAVAVAGYGIFYVVLLTQKRKVAELEETMNKIKNRRLGS